VNYATMVGGSGREAGSAFKAFTLAAAMQAGYNLNAYWYGPSTLAVPGCTDPTQPDGLWHPVNAGDGEAGTFTLAAATAHTVGTQVIDSNDANLVTSALQGVVTGGTGVDAAIPPYPVAGKTGTANENVDAWFCGYTVQIATCVWMGWPAGEIPLQDVEGVSSV